MESRDGAGANPVKELEQRYGGQRKSAGGTSAKL